MVPNSTFLLPQDIERVSKGLIPDSRNPLGLSGDILGTYPQNSNYSFPFPASENTRFSSKNLEPKSSRVRIQGTEIGIEQRLQKVISAVDRMEREISTLYPSLQHPILQVFKAVKSFKESTPRNTLEIDKWFRTSAMLRKSIECLSDDLSAPNGLSVIRDTLVKELDLLSDSMGIARTLFEPQEPESIHSSRMLFSLAGLGSKISESLHSFLESLKFSQKDLNILGVCPGQIQKLSNVAVDAGLLYRFGSIGVYEKFSEKARNAVAEISRALPTESRRGETDASQHLQSIRTSLERFEESLSFAAKIASF